MNAVAVLARAAHALPAVFVAALIVALGSTARVALAQDDEQGDAHDRESIAATRTIELHVSTFVGTPPTDARPGIAVVIGAARSGADARGPVCAHKLELAQGVTGDDGVVTLSIEVPADALDAWGADAVLWGRVVGAWTGNESIAALPDGPTGRFAVYRSPTTNLHGVVVDTAGHPVAATVRAFRRTESERRPWILAATATTDETGAYRLGLEEPGAHRVYAESLDHGTATASGVVAGEERLPIALDLTVRGPGVLTGVVRESSGRPLPSVFLRARRAGEAAEANATTNAFERDAVLPMYGADGLVEAEARTDADGRFRIAGLTAGEYVIDAYTGDTRSYGERLTARAVHADGTPLELVSARRRILVRAFDHAGERIDLAPSYELYHVPIPEHGLYVFECDDSGRVTHAHRDADSAPARVALPNGDIAIDARAGARYVIGVVSRACPLVESYATVPSGDEPPVVALHLEPPSPGTTLSATLEGRRPGTREDRSRYVVRSPTSGAFLWYEYSRFGKPGVEVRIGPGSYRLVSRGLRNIAMCGTGLPVHRAQHAPADDLVTLAPGERTHVVQRLRPTGSLRLTVHGDDPPAPTAEDARPPARPEDLLRPSSVRQEDLRRWNGGAHVTLQRLDDPNALPERPEFDLGPANSWEGMYGSQGFAAPWVPLNDGFTTSSAILPGRYRLIVEREDLGTIERDVEIRAGETSEVRVSFAD